MQMMSLKKETQEQKLRRELAEHHPQLSLGQLVKQIEHNIKDRKANENSSFRTASEVLKGKKSKEENKSSPPRLSTRRGFALKRSPTRQTSLTSFFSKGVTKVKATSGNHHLSESESDAEATDGDVKVNGTVDGHNDDDDAVETLDDDVASNDSKYDSEANQEFDIEEYSLSDLEEEERKEEEEEEKMDEDVQKTPSSSKDTINSMWDSEHKSKVHSKYIDEASPMQTGDTTVKSKSNYRVEIKNEKEDVKLFLKDEIKEVIDNENLSSEVKYDYVSSSSKCKIGEKKEIKEEKVSSLEGDNELSFSKYKVEVKKEIKDDEMSSLGSEGSEVNGNEYKATPDSKATHKKQSSLEDFDEVYNSDGLQHNVLRETCKPSCKNSFNDDNPRGVDHEKTIPVLNRKNSEFSYYSCDKNNHPDQEENSKQTDKKRRRSSSTRLEIINIFESCEDYDEKPKIKKSRLSDNRTSQQTNVKLDQKAISKTHSDACQQESSRNDRSEKSHRNKSGSEACTEKSFSSVNSPSTSDARVQQNFQHTSKDSEKSDKKSKRDPERSGKSSGKSHTDFTKESDLVRGSERCTNIRDSLKYNNRKSDKDREIKNSNKSSTNSTCKPNQSLVERKCSTVLLEKQTETFTSHATRNTSERPQNSAKAANSIQRATNTSTTPEGPKEKPSHRGATVGKEKQQVADWVVKYLMPHYRSNAIQGKTVFKALARQLSHNIVLRTQDTGERERETNRWKDRELSQLGKGV